MMYCIDDNGKWNIMTLWDVNMLKKMTLVIHQTHIKLGRKKHHEVSPMFPRQQPEWWERDRVWTKQSRGECSDVQPISAS